MDILSFTESNMSGGGGLLIELNIKEFCRM